MVSERAAVHGGVSSSSSSSSAARSARRDAPVKTDLEERSGGFSWMAFAAFTMVVMVGSVVWLGVAVH